LIRGTRGDRRARDKTEHHAIAASRSEQLYDDDDEDGDEQHADDRPDLHVRHHAARHSVHASPLMSLAFIARSLKCFLRLVRAPEEQD
jgi:hypothetical protein